MQEFVIATLEHKFHNEKSIDRGTIANILFITRRIPCTQDEEGGIYFRIGGENQTPITEGKALTISSTHDSLGNY